MRKFALGIAALVLCFSAFPAFSEDARQPCAILVVRPDAVLLNCGDRVRSINLAMKDISRTAAPDMNSGGIAFICPVDQMCKGEPQIGGWLIDPRRWTRSERDAATLFSLLLTPPALMARRGRNPWSDTPPPTPKASCEIFDIQIAGLPGRAVCYEAEDQKSAGLFAVVADEEVGFVMGFQSRELDDKALRAKAMTMLPGLVLETATGDAGLLRWMR